MASTSVGISELWGSSGSGKFVLAEGGALLKKLNHHPSNVIGFCSLIVVIIHSQFVTGIYCGITKNTTKYMI